MDVRNMTNNAIAISRYLRGDTGDRSLMGGKTSRGAPTDLGGAIKRGIAFKMMEFLYTKAKDMPTDALSAASSA